NAAIDESRSDLYDRASITRQHPFQCREGAMHDAQVGHIGHSPVFAWLHLFDWRKDGSHRVVNPNIDWAEPALDGGSSLLNSIGICDVCGYGDGVSTQGLDLTLGRLQPLDATGQQANLCPMAPKFPGHS